LRLLLDTHVVLWQLAGDRELGDEAVAAIAGSEELLFSVVSFAEIGAKAAAGKLTVPGYLRERVLAAGVRTMQLEAEHALAVTELPLHHRDPFDRLLISQARAERLTLVSADRRLPAYDVPVIPALA